MMNAPLKMTTMRVKNCLTMTKIYDESSDTASEHFDDNDDNVLSIVEHSDNGGVDDNVFARIEINKIKQDG